MEEVRAAEPNGFLESLPDLSILLSEARPDVRKGAAEVLAAYAGSSDVMACLFDETSGSLDRRVDDLVKSLANATRPDLIHQANSADTALLSAALNFSGAGEQAVTLLAKHGMIDQSVAALVARDSDLDKLHAGILANAARHEVGVNSLMGKDRSPTLQIVWRQRMRELLSTRLLGDAPQKKPRLDSLALMVGGIAATSEGREMLLSRESAGDEPSIFGKVGMLLSSESAVLRHGGASMLRNLAVSEDMHQLITMQNFVEFALVPLVVSNEEVSNADRKGMPSKLLTAVELAADAEPAVNGESRCEPEEDVRIALVEGLLLLCKTSDGREALKRNRAYPILRNLHKTETNEKVRELVESIVDRTELLDDEGRPEQSPVASQD